MYLRVARNASKIDAKRGDHVLQADFPPKVPLTPFLDNFRGAEDDRWRRNRQTCHLKLC